MVEIPAAPGSYVLHLSLYVPQRLEIGWLGSFSFPAGDYLYAGSANGPGGLRARLNRHLRGDGKLHWHIDWLRKAAHVQGGWYAAVPGNLECIWSRAFNDMPGAVIPLPGFGAADCRNRCPAHLVAFPAGIDHAGIYALFESTTGRAVVRFK